MNPVLAYAIEHQAEARKLLVAVFGLRGDDVDDLSQAVLYSILRADPHATQNVRAYWKTVIRTAVAGFWRKRQHDLRPVAAYPVTESEVRDPHQDPEAAVLRCEQMREVWGSACPADRTAILALLNGPPYGSTMRARIFRLRRRLRERMAAG